MICDIPEDEEAKLNPNDVLKRLKLPNDNALKK